MIIPNCSISDARNQVNNLNNISLFIGSGSLEFNDDAFKMLLTKLQDEIEKLDCCLLHIETLQSRNDAMRNHSIFM